MVPVSELITRATSYLPDHGGGSKDSWAYDGVRDRDGPDAGGVMRAASVPGRTQVFGKRAGDIGVSTEDSPRFTSLRRKIPR